MRHHPYAQVIAVLYCMIVVSLPTKRYLLLFVEPHSSGGVLPVTAGQIAQDLEAHLLEFTLMANAREQAAAQAKTAQEAERTAWREKETRRIVEKVGQRFLALLCLQYSHIMKYDDWHSPKSTIITLYTGDQRYVAGGWHASKRHCQPITTSCKVPQ